MNIIQENQDYRLLVEKVNSEIWLELHHRASGEAQILIHKRGCGHTQKSITKAYASMTLEAIKALFDRAGIPLSPMYKKGL